MFECEKNCFKWSDTDRVIIITIGWGPSFIRTQKFMKKMFGRGS